MTVREFTSKCANPFMWVDVLDHVTGKNVVCTSDINAFKNAEHSDKNSSSYEFYAYLHDFLDREVKEFRYVFDFCMEEGFVLYV